MAFKLEKKSASTYASPEALFHDLRNRTVQGLLNHQGHMLNAYQESWSCPDVAIQMPTGSGKTLVGLLIAEWRRRTRQERVVYLCPNKLLVNQVVEQASRNYGISTNAFVGSQRDYQVSAKSDYANADVIAVTTYSSLFNTNPFFNDPHVIVLDDAHAAEHYIGDFWSLVVEEWNSAHKQLFNALLSVLKDVITSSDYASISGGGEGGGGGWVNKLPAPALFEKHRELFDLFEVHCGADCDRNLHHTWKVLRDHLSACNLYYGRGRILVRPLIVPTESHAPFANALQRVYMSATLGDGGELERIVGKRKLIRVPTPESWKRQGFGRRLFFFPMRSLDEEKSFELVVDLIKETDRTLILTASEVEAERYRGLVKEALPNYQLFSAKDIEESKGQFVGTDNAIAIAANRYDGIDLNGAECRLLVASGLPSATNLQEHFLMSRMAVPFLYEDRIRTRIIQATGRCTRSAIDYAAVVILGEQLNRFLLQPESRRYLHPELQAEVEFGLSESKGMTVNGFVENFRLLLNHSEAWNEADRHIVSERESLSQSELPCNEHFAQAAEHEVGFQYALWSGDFQTALEQARKVLTTIAIPEELRGYRAFWHYLAGNAAWLLHLSGIQGMDATAREYYSLAAKATKGIFWMYELGRLTLPGFSTDLLDDIPLDSMVEQIEQELDVLGIIHDRDFERRLKEILDGLDQTDAKPFEKAQMLLGRLLGLRSGNSEDDSAPDPWWVLNENEGIVFEDYTEAKEGAVISTTKVRQAVSHPAWLTSKQEYADVKFTVVMVTPVAILGAGARPSSSGCFYWELNDFVAWAKEAILVIRAIRGKFQRPGDLAWRAEAKEALLRSHLAPSAILERAQKVRLDSLPVCSDK